MIRLIRRDGEFPPAGFAFTDPKTGFKFNGLEAGGFNDQVRRIIQHRAVNPVKYPPANSQAFDFDAVAMELEAYQCLRLGNNPRYCFDTDNKSPTRVYPASRINGVPICPVCKQAMSERYCPGCSGQRLIGYRCEKCHTEADK